MSRRATVYVMTDWITFPSSEYGGLIVALARGDDEAIALCRENDSHSESLCEFLKNIPSRVRNAERVEVETDEPSRIIAEFRT